MSLALCSLAFIRIECPLATFKMIAQNGATSSLPQFTAYRDPGDFSLFLPAGTLFQADGKGSQITLLELVSADGPIDWKVRGIPTIQFQATGGGSIQLPKLTTLTGRTALTASDPGSLVNATNLASITGPDS